MTDHADAAPARAAYSMAEAAQALGISFQLMKMAVAQGAIRSQKIGALRRISVKEVERVAAEGMPAVTYPPRRDKPASTRPKRSKRRN